MSTVSIQADDAPAGAASKRQWVSAAGILAVGVVAFGAAFWNEIVHAYAVWLDSTAYGHCFLIIPISAFLIWERRAALLARLPEPTFWPILAMVPVGLAWLLAAQVGVMEGRQLMAMALFELFVLAVLGFRTWRVISFALLYLFFLVPSGAFLVPALQQFAAAFAVWWVQLFGVPIYADQLMIEVPGARFVVAEACAGLRFLIAAVAVGTLYGYMIYRTWQRRLAFVAVSLVVPIIANGFRVLGIVMLGYYLSSAQAATADHLIYGWVFFSFVLLLLFLMGLPFRQAPVAFPVTPTGQQAAAQSPTAILMAGAAGILFMVILASPLIAGGPVAATLGSSVSGLKHALGR